MRRKHVQSMGRPGKKRRKTEKIVVDVGELHSIVDATDSRLLTEAEKKKLHDGCQLLDKLLGADFRNDESSAAVLGNENDENATTSPEEQAKPRAPGHGRRRRDAYGAAKVVHLAHPSFRPGDLCPCGCGGRLYLVKRLRHFRHFVGQAPIQVTLYEQEQLRSNRCEQIFSAPLPEGVGPSPYDATAVSTIALNKYGMGLPFYRQEQVLEILGTPIPASTQYEVVADALSLLRPAYEHLLYLGAQGKLGYFDDSGMKILLFQRDPSDDRTGIHTTAIVSVHELFRIAMFFTGREHCGENKAALLRRREPDLQAMIQMTDALSSNFVGNDSAEDVFANCMAHARRNFIKVVESFPEECRHVLTALGAIYHNDSQSKKAENSEAERLLFHQQQSAPVMKDLKAWLDQQIDNNLTEPNSSLGKAIQYMRNHWEPLTLFLRVPGAPLDNNIAERVLKKVVLHRKNSLFYRTASGAKTGDIYMTLIQTCQLNGANPFDYLTALQRNSAAVTATPSEWMPWNFQATLDLSSSRAP